MDWPYLGQKTGESVEVEGTQGGRGWEYLLGMPLWSAPLWQNPCIICNLSIEQLVRSLTAERVANLLAQLKEKEAIKARTEPEASNVWICLKFEFFPWPTVGFLVAL